MIACDESINFGQPALIGRRLTVYDIVTKIYYEENLTTALDEYEISIGDAKDALKYCMELKCRSDSNLVHYCDGCLLRTFHEGFSFNKGDFIEIEENGTKIVISKDKGIFF